MKLRTSSSWSSATLLLAPLVAGLLAPALAGPKKYSPDNASALQVADSNALLQDEAAAGPGDDREPAPRFGIQTNTISTTGASGLFPGLNPGPIKLDLGGLLLGAVLGLGAVLVLPKLLHSVAPLAGGYDGYKRSEDGAGAGGASETGLAEALARVDAALARHHVDSSACVQRAVCGLVRGARGRVQAGDAGLLDNALDSLAGADLVGMMLDGTAVKSAVDVGRRGGDCGSSFAGCVASREALLAALRGLAASSASSDSSTPPSSAAK